MKAMILAAGRGKRMMPLTAKIPKPLLYVNGMSLIEHNINALKQANINDIVINTAYLGKQIEQHLGNGSRYQANISYSREQDKGLETAGGIINALPLLGKQAFIVINGDVLCDYPLQNLHSLPEQSLAHLILTPNPPHNPQGDFGLNDNHQLTLKTPHQPHYTFTGLALYHPDFFMGYPNTTLALYPLFKKAIAQHTITAQIHTGFWHDVGTPERLRQLQSPEV